jgi:hypothetical protein
MKYLILVLSALICSSVQAQNWGREFGVNYVYSKPMGGMGQTIQQAHGATLNFGLVNPSRHFSFGIDVSLAEYGRDKSRQEYTLEDGSVAPMDIIVSNTFVNAMAYSKWYLVTEGLFRPYLVGKLGYAGFNTALNIYDPDDADHCEPVDSDVLYHDGTWLTAIGAGVKVDFATVFKRIQKSKFYLESNINFTQGGQVRYMNADAHANHANHSTPGSEHVMADFLNTETLIVHRHHVGHLYTSTAQMTEIRIGFSMNISR